MTTDGLSGFPLEWARDLVKVALREDLGPDGVDVTTLATIPAGQTRTAEIVARAPGVVAGVPVIDLVLRAVADRISGDVPSVEIVSDDGTRLQRGDVIARITGPRPAADTCARTSRLATTSTSCTTCTSCEAPAVGSTSRWRPCRGPTSTASTSAVRHRSWTRTGHVRSQSRARTCPCGIRSR